MNGVPASQNENSPLVPPPTQRRGSIGLSPSSWSISRLARQGFVFAALFQMIIVVILQALIYHFGGDGRVLPEYRHCLSDDLQMAINCSEKANWTNVTIPSFGEDERVYVGFIISLTVFNAMLCIYALFGKHFLEIISFLIVNILTMMYACFEAWQFRPFAPNCSDLPIACQLAIGTVVVLLVFTVLFVLLVVSVYKDFSRKIERDVNHDDQITKYYQWYKGLSSGIKLLILFSVIFLVAELALLIDITNSEFGVTCILLVVVLMAYFVIQLTIHYNSFTGHIVIICAGVLLFSYYVFKTARFAKENCPKCIQMKDALDKEYNDLKDLFHVCIHNETAEWKDDIDRSVQFENLAVFASVNALTTIAVFVMYLGFWCSFPGDRLKDHFQNNPSWIVRIFRYRRTGNEPLYVQIKKAKFQDVISITCEYSVQIRKAIAEAFGCPIKKNQNGRTLQHVDGN